MVEGTILCSEVMNKYAYFEWLEKIEKKNRHSRRSKNQRLSRNLNIFGENKCQISLTLCILPCNAT